ncbi:MAG: YfhO family protein, partial [Oscillospiraceae bacterium]|nr:YfhO family protein [Oscillospiraceae bacterium]
PVLGMFTLMIIRGFIPFGRVSMLYSDMYHQYYPFFAAFRRALINGDSLLYNWNVGMGMDYLGLISYYLASPLNLLSVLVPESMLLGYFSLLMPIKLGLAGLFFGIFLKKTFHKDDFSIPVFGCFYAFCAWALGYHWNIMWLDTFALLPLVALGTIALLKERKFALYTISLFLSVFSNYYIGLFTCVFVALVFLCYEICRWQGIKRFIMDLGRIALYSVLAIGMTAILELPAYAALQTTQSSINKFPQGFQLNITDEDTWMGLLDAMRQVAGNMNGGLTPSFKEGLPNLYCGVAATVFAFLFLTCKQVKLRDKICSVVLLLFFNLSIIIRQLDYIWHGFHFTNMIPYRFTFLYSFVLLYMAYQAWVLRNRFRLWQILVAGLLATGIALCANDLTDPVYWAYNGVFLLLYIATLFFPFLSKTPQKEATFEEKRAFVKERKYQRKLSAGILLGVMVMEIILNLVNFGVSFTGTIVSDYPRGREYTASMIRYMKEREKYNLFYRAETTHSQTLNDGALNDYYGISTFTSSANVSTTRFMKALGYGAKDTYNRYCFEEGSPVSNLFLNLKYMLERQGRVEENNYFEDLHKYGNVHLLENKAYLPLGFLAENQLLELDFATAGNESLEFQNELFRAATGVQEDVWSFITGRNLTISGDDVDVTSYTQNGYCAFTTTPETGGVITYEYIADQEGLLCVGLDLYKIKNFSFWKNGIELYDESFSIPQTLAVSQVVPGDVVQVQLICNANEKGTANLDAAVLNDRVFQQGYSILAASTLELTSFENTRMEGTIRCDREGVLYTSIPQDGNWLAIVDDELAQTVTVGNAMVGLLMTEGEHSVSFIYRNKYFSLGWKISLACLAVFVGLYISIYQPKRKKGKYEK